MPKFVGERVLSAWDEDDGGELRMAEIDLERVGDEEGLYVLLQSFYMDKLHAEWEQLKNKRVRITVETID